MGARWLARSRLPLGSFFAQQPSQSQMKIHTHTHTLRRLEFERAHFFQVPLFISDNMSDNQLQMLLMHCFYWKTESCARWRVLMGNVGMYQSNQGWLV